MIENTFVTTAINESVKEMGEAWTKSQAYAEKFSQQAIRTIKTIEELFFGEHQLSFDPSANSWVYRTTKPGLIHFYRYYLKRPSSLNYPLANSFG